MAGYQLWYVMISPMRHCTNSWLLQFLRAPLSSQEWERVMYYTRRIRIFRNMTRGGTHPSLLAALKDAPDTLFPNLLSFEWPFMCNPGDDMDLFNSFLSSRLSNLTITGKVTTDAIATLQTVPRATVGFHLRTFKFAFPSSPHPDFLPAYRSFLQSIKTLEKLDTWVEDRDTYVDIARLPNLRDLSLTITTKAAWPRDLLSTVQFPFCYLRTLSLRIDTVNLSLFSRFLQLAMFDQLASIFLEIPPFDGSEDATTYRDPEKDFLGLANTIVAQCSTDHLRCVGIFVTDIFYDMFVEHPTIQPHHIAPLLGFRRLQSFYLHVDWKLDFDNATLETIVSSWPHLRCLSLAPRSTSRPPRLTFSGLQTLRICTNLHTFRSSFLDDVSSPESYESIDKEKLPNIPSVSVLDVGISEPINNQNMARYLAALFPNLEAIHYDRGTPPGSPSPNPDWDDVIDHLSL